MVQAKDQYVFVYMAIAELCKRALGLKPSVPRKPNGRVRLCVGEGREGVRKGRRGGGGGGGEGERGERKGGREREREREIHTLQMIYRVHSPTTVTVYVTACYYVASCLFHSYN